MLKSPFFITLLVWLACALLANKGIAQNVEKKSSSSYKIYKNEREKASADELLKEAEALKDNDPAAALDKVEEALGVSLAREDEFNEGKAYLMLAVINEGISEWRLALENYSRAYEKLLPYRKKAEYKAAVQGLGTSHLKLGHYDEALKYLQEALTLSDKRTAQDDIRLAISEVYYQKGQYTEAQKSLEGVGLRGKMIEPDVRVQNQQAKIYARTNELDKTKDLYNSSINTLRSEKGAEPQQQQSLQQAKEEIADVLREQKKYDDEIALRNKSIEYNLDNNNMGEVAKDKVEISKTLAAKGDNSAALRAIEDAARIAETLDDPKEQANAYLTLADQYELNGRPTQAITAYKKYSVAVAEWEKRNQTEKENQSALILKQKNIEELTKNVSLGQREETIELAIVTQQRLIIYGLLALLSVIVVTSYFIYKNAQASKVANQLLALKSLRSQMNPHFIFNALNSVNHFIAEQDERTANRFLSEFSQLMRLVLENSQEDFISLQKEQDILSLYLKLEHYRFRDKFDYTIETDPTINADNIEVPPMLIQPYIENAVWHGLRYKESKGQLTLRYLKENDNLVVEITDDGIGRKKSAALKTENQKKHNSTGLRNIQERLAIINKVYKASYRVTIEDMVNESGTRVRIQLPVTNHLKEKR